MNGSDERRLVLGLALAWSAWTLDTVCIDYRDRDNAVSVRPSVERLAPAAQRMPESSSSSLPVARRRLQYCKSGGET